MDENKAKKRTVRHLDNPEIKAMILKWVGEALQSRRDCCKRLNVDIKQLNLECKYDKQFAADLAKAEWMAEDMLVGKMVESKDWRSAKELLSRKYFARWGQNENTFSHDDMLIFATTLMAMVTRYVPSENEAALNAEFRNVVANFSKLRPGSK